MNCEDANANQLACGGEQMCLISLRGQHQQQELTETESDRVITVQRNWVVVVPSTWKVTAAICLAWADRDRNGLLRALSNENNTNKTRDV